MHYFFECFKKCIDSINAIKSVADEQEDKVPVPEDVHSGMFVKLTPAECIELCGCSKDGECYQVNSQHALLVCRQKGYMCKAIYISQSMWAIWMLTLRAASQSTAHFIVPEISFNGTYMVLSWMLALLPRKLQSRLAEVKNSEWRLGFELWCIQ